MYYQITFCFQEVTNILQQGNKINSFLRYEKKEITVLLEGFQASNTRENFKTAPFPSLNVPSLQIFRFPCKHSVPSGHAKHSSGHH